MKSSLRWEQIKNTSDIWEVVYPAEFDIENIDSRGRGNSVRMSSIMYNDFSLIKKLRWNHVKYCASAIKYPEDFDIENADFIGRNIGESDFSLIGSNVTDYEPIINDNISSSTGFEPVILGFN